MGSTDQLPLIRGLLRPAAYPHAVERITLLETHISWVILTGPFAYKLKKPVDLGFLDFTSLERRHHFCREELRLNRRFGSDLYLAVLPVGGSVQDPRLGGAGPALDYAVQMRQFDQADLLPAALARGAIAAEQLEAFAEQLARFHGAAAVAAPTSGFGTPQAVREPVLANLHTLLSRPAAELPDDLRRALLALQAWSAQELQRQTPRLLERLAAGRVRECHGDLHLGNLVLHRGRIEAFDCLEFSPALRWIDVISDLAFLVMDLQHRGQPPFAVALLNRWLERSGDHDGLLLWRWYSVYRALVRAKVAALAGQGEALRAYVARAEALSRQPAQLLLLCHGLSGSGKSHHSARLIGPLAAIRLRSDVERKRLFAGRGDLYAPELSEALFSRHLPAAAAAALAAGFNVIVDATFLRRTDRDAMQAVAAAAGVPLLILDLQAPPALLRQRIQQRRQRGGDPSDADLVVLERQRQAAQPLTAAERRLAIPVRPHQNPLHTLQLVRQRLAAGPQSGPQSGPEAGLATR